MEKDKKTLLQRGVDEIVVAADLENKLQSGKPLRVKHGIDPTTNRLHLGYAVVYEKLRQFQEAGHKVVFLIGGFTGRFGDPTDKTESRTLRSKKDVAEAAKNYLEQLGKILDLNKIEVRNNSEWYDKMSAEDLIKLMSEFTAMRMLERDIFQKRLQRKQAIGLHELVYPILQGYDSYELEADVTVIGSDQKFNELQARGLQEARGQKPQDLIITPLLIGTDGKDKMSQSLGNDIGIAEEPKEQYGKLMSIPDEQIIPYFTLITRLPLTEISELEKQMKNNKLNPRDAKAKLAFEIVKQYHSKAEAKKAEAEFNRTFRDKQTPSDIPKITVNSPVQDLAGFLVQINQFTKIKSKSEAKRLIAQGGVKINGKIFKDPNAVIPARNGMIFTIGKKRFIEVDIRN
ncbi:MAG: tyrosine--tRNA ligase [bacterium]